METLLIAIENYPWPAFWLGFFCLSAVYGICGGFGRRRA